jgi:histone H3/H4
MSSWRYCSSCRSEIEFEQVYWECSVSTCARVAKTGLFFCSVSCWEAHLPTMRHREAWAVEKRAPTEGAWRRQLEEEPGAESADERTTERAPEPARPAPSPIRNPEARTDAPRRVITPETQTMDDTSTEDTQEILIVASKLKRYIRARSAMNTSDGVMAVLSDHLRKLCDLAVRHAAEDGRKTVLDRDFKAIL